MSWGLVIKGAVAIGGAYLSNRAQKKATEGASQAQQDASQLGIDEQRRQFDAVQKLLAPYVNAGTGAMAGQQDLLGLNGAQAQQGAIAGIQSSPMFGAMAAQGEDAILQNASATGGLRGGNVQGALAQFRPQLLGALIDQQYQRLGGLSQMGQASAAGVGSAGMQTGTQVANLLGQQGAAQAGAALAGGRADGQLINGVTGAIGSFIGGGGIQAVQGMFGGSTPPPAVASGWKPEPTLF